MRLMFLFLLTLSPVFWGTGCTNSSEREADFRVRMDSWLGQSEAKLIAETGPAPYSRDDGQGGKILIYGRAGWWCRMFYVNPKGIIYSWRFDVFGF
jgi:hypothetical protein